MQENSDQNDHVEKRVRRRTGLFALHRLRQMVDGERQLEQTNALWAKRIWFALGLVALLVIIWLLTLR